MRKTKAPRAMQRILIHLHHSEATLDELLESWGGKILTLPLFKNSGSRETEVSDPNSRIYQVEGKIRSCIVARKDLILTLP